MNMNVNIKSWNSIYDSGKAGSFLNYPSDYLVTLFFQNKSIIKQEGRCLDFGFGSGNNSEFLIQYMRELFGFEISKSCVEIVGKRLKKYPNYNENNFIISCENTSNDFSCFFDLIVAWQVLYYNDRLGVEKTLISLYNMLTNDGVLMATLITPIDIKVNYSKQIDDDIYIIDERIPHQQGCIIYSPHNDDIFYNLFSNYFEIIDYGKYERISKIKKHTSVSEYFIVARKK